MQAQVIPFQFDANPVRTMLIDDQPWFVASDVAYALHYRDAFNMCRNLDDDEKGTQIVSTPCRDEKGRQIVPTLGGDQEMLVINESGLYSAILRSRKAEAKRFKKWVTAEVLPAIRKYGRYEDEQGRMPTLVSELIGMSELNVIKGTMRDKAKDVAPEKRRSFHAAMCSRLHTRFNVPRLEMIPADQFEAACNFVAAYALEGQWLPRQEAANDFDYPAAWIWQNNPALTAGPQRVNGHNGLFLGLKVLAPSEFKSPIWDAIRKLKAQGANTEGLEIEWKARKELMYLLSKIIEDAAYRLNEHMQHAPFFPVPDSRPLLD